MIKSESSSMNPFWFVPESEKDDPTPTRFRIKGLTSAQKIDVNSEVDMANGTISLKGCLLAFKYGLLGWDNFDASFNEKNARANLDALPAEVVYEIAGRIIDGSEPSEEQVKNSG